MMKKFFLTFVLSLLPLMCPANETARYSFKFSTEGVPASSSATKSISNLTGDVVNFAIEEKILNYKDLKSAKRGSSEINIYNNASPGTVLILTDTGSGSGALITNSGYIITNQHVVGSNSKVKVIFKPEGIDFSPNKLSWIEGTVEKVSQQNDLALVKIEFVPQGARPIPMRNTTYPEVGADAHAIGHPIGEFWTYTRGYVSQIRGNYEWQYGDEPMRSATIIQTQTPINPGNSGGPLIDANGSLIGLNSFGKPDYPGINYAVSNETIQKFLKTPRENLDKTNASSAKVRASDRTTSSGDPCGKNPLQEVRDQNDWLGEFYRIDYDPNCVGRATLQIAIPDDQSKPIVIAMEHETVEGVIGTMLLDEDRDDQIDVTFVDVDGDGEFDFEGYNKPGERIAGTLSRIDS
jgi:S1-C subfamily serine protease